MTIYDVRQIDAAILEDGHIATGDIGFAGDRFARQDSGRLREYRGEVLECELIASALLWIAEKLRLNFVPRS